jgi:predicted metal-dependent hydrolase
MPGSLPLLDHGPADLRGFPRVPWSSFGKLPGIKRGIRSYMHVAVMQVLHIADLHIRTGVTGRARCADYLETISNVVSLGKQLAESSPVVTVIAGDVLHDRTALDPHSVRVFNAAVTGLASFGQVVVIQGNHDHHPNHLDEVAPHDVLGELLRLADVPGVTYLDKSGHFVLDGCPGIGFGVVTVHDSMPEGEARSGQTAPTFPFPSPVPGLVNVALYHGALQGSRNDGGAERSGVAPTWFAGYDAVMLGDQHVQQIGNHDVDGDCMKIRATGTDPTWAYPGSLIQQSHGESLWNHGAIVWDFAARTVRPVHVRCPGGYVTLRGDSLLYDGKWQRVDLHLQDPDFPKHVEARCKDDDAEEAIAVMEAAGVAVTTRRATRAKDVVDVGPADAPPTFCDWRECVREHIDLDTVVAAACIPELTEPSLAQLAGPRNARLDRLARDAKSGGPVIKAAIRPLVVRWDGLLCYGPGNEAAFLSDDGVVLVSGGNGAGKTAFLEVILLALFGEGFPSRACGSAAVINTERMEATAEMEFQVSGKRYRVFRKWTRSSKDPSKATTKAELFSTQGAKATALCKGRAAVDEWVSENVCTVADFLSGPMLSQAGDNDVLTLSGRDSAALLERAYGLSGIDKLSELLTDAGNGLKQIVTRAEALLNGVDKAAFDEARAEYKAARKESSTLKDALSKLANPPRPDAAKLAAAQKVVSEATLFGVKDHDPWAHVRDAQALSAVRACSMPSKEESPYPGSVGHEKMAFGTVSSLWTRYAHVVDDVGRRGLRHGDLLSRPELVRDLAKDAAEEVDYGAEIDRLAREASKAMAAERVARRAVSDANEALRVAEEAHADTVAQSLVARYDMCDKEWTTDPLELEEDLDDCDIDPEFHAQVVNSMRARLVLGYLTHAGASVLPDAAALSETVALREDVLKAETFEAALGVMGAKLPTFKGARCTATVPECVKALAEAESRLAAARKLTADIADQSAAATAALRNQVMSKTDEDALDALRWLESAWAPLRDVDLDAAIAERDSEVARLVAACKAHEAAKELSDAFEVVISAEAYGERKAVQAKLDALDLDRKAMEWGRVRGCEAVLADAPAIQLCRDRLEVVTKASARLKGLKNWLYSEKIAPEIAARANSVISQVAAGLKVACVVSEDGTVSWTVDDGVRAVSPARASGFQRFMVSMALRVVFGGMLAPCSLFVIDEGFTACDRDHLARVPAFLEWIVRSGHADTVVLVSHLTEIREHVPKVVDLVRGDPFIA